MHADVPSEGLQTRQEPRAVRLGRAASVQPQVGRGSLPLYAADGITGKPLILLINIWTAGIVSSCQIILNVYNADIHEGFMTHDAEETSNLNVLMNKL